MNLPIVEMSLSNIRDGSWGDHGILDWVDDTGEISYGPNFNSDEIIYRLQFIIWFENYRMLDW